MKIAIELHGRQQFQLSSDIMPAENIKTDELTNSPKEANSVKTVIDQTKISQIYES